MIRKFILFSLMISVVVSCDEKKPQLSFGSVSGSVLDGSTGAALSGVSITALDAFDDNATSAADGTFTISSIEATSHTLRASLSGYDTQDQSVLVPVNSTLTGVNYVMLPASYSSGKVVIVLTWGTQPTDLDSYLYVPDGSPFYEISYGALGDSTLSASPFASLDLDDTNGTGPETTRIKMNGTGAYYGGTYRFFVHNFSGEVPLTSSQASVRVYIDGTLTKTYQVPATGAGAYWHVFDLSGSTLTDVNVISSTQPNTP